MASMLLRSTWGLALLAWLAVAPTYAATGDAFFDSSLSDFAGQEMTEKAFARAHKVRGTPTFLFIGVDGREMARYTGAARDVEEFMALDRFVIDGHYRKTGFEQFYPDRR